MSTPTPSGAATAAGPPPSGAAGSRRAGRLSIGNIVRSLGLLLLIVCFLVVFEQRGGQRVHVVNPVQTYIGAAREAGFPLDTPHGLSSGWRCTDARDQSPGSGVTLHVGYVTPDDHYAELVETDAARSKVFAQHLAADPVAHGTVSVDGKPWQRYRSNEHGELALVRTTRVGSRDVTYLVSGSAGVRELTTLAASLAPFHAPA